MRERSRSRFLAVLFLAGFGAVGASRLDAANTTSVGSGAPWNRSQPTLGLRMCIASAGDFPNQSSGAGDVPILGEVRAFGFDFCPAGWLVSDGSIPDIAQYPSLASVLGTTWGGNGTTTFGLPDLRNRTFLGTGQGPGLSNYTLGSSTGSTSVTLTSSQLAAHTHSMAGGAQTGSVGTSAPISLLRPSTTLTPYISSTGVFDLLSEMRYLAGAGAPTGFLPATGSLAPIGSSVNLFSKIGTTYGGNGSSTFGLPDLRGRGAISSGQGPGLSDYYRGNLTGQESVALALANDPLHSHTTAAGPTGSAGSGTPVDIRPPTLAITWVIALYGVFPNPGGSPNLSGQPTIGEILPFAGNVIPSYYMACEGQLLPISENETLYVLLGTTFGGDGQDTFALPDLRGRVPIGTGQRAGDPIPGETYGAELLSLGAPALPAHVHAQPPPEIAVSGLSTNILDGDVTPIAGDDTKYAPVDPASAAVTHTFTVQNVGLGDMTLSASISGSSAFALASTPAAVVAPGGNTTFQVSFDPAAEGIFNATVMMANEDPDEAPFDFSLSGNGATALATRRPGRIGPSALTLRKNVGDPSRIDLAWSGACGVGATGTAAYAGDVGDFSSHLLVAGGCNLPGTSASSIDPGAGDRYFLLSEVDAYAEEEGSLGNRSDGVEAFRPAGGCTAAMDLGHCPFLALLDGATNQSRSEQGTSLPLPALGWTAFSGAAQAFDAPGYNGALVGTTPYGNYGLEYRTDTPVRPNVTYTLTVKMGFVASIAGGNAGYLLQLGTVNGGVFTQLGQSTGTVSYAGNLSGGTISGTGQVVVTTGVGVSGNELVVRWEQTSTAGTSDYFGIDDVTLAASN